MQLDIYFAHIWLFVLLSLALQNYPQKKKKNPQPLQDASHLQWGTLPPRMIHHLTLSLQAYSQVGWFFFLSKHLPSPKSRFWTRLVTTMMRREDLITSNTSQTGRRRVVSSPLSKWKPVFSQWQIRLNSHTHSISSFPPQKHSLFIWTRIHKSYFAEGH